MIDKLGLIIIPCTPNNPEWEITKAQNDPGENKENE